MRKFTFVLTAMSAVGLAFSGVAIAATGINQGKLLSRVTGTGGGVMTNTVAGNDFNGSFSGTYTAK